jgi:hypothetical protein
LHYSKISSNPLHEKLSGGSLAAEGGSAMIALMVSFLFGTVLGQRFKVVVLVPAMAAVLILCVAAGIADPHAAWEVIRMAASAAICLQCGYFAGMAIRHCLTAAPSGSPPLVNVEASTDHPAR